MKDHVTLKTEKVVLNDNNISQYSSFYCMFDQINAFARILLKVNKYIKNNQKNLNDSKLLTRSQKFYYVLLCILLCIIIISFLFV